MKPSNVIRPTAQRTLRVSRRVLGVALLLSLAVSAACSENPDERTLVQEPRLVAVRADPPVLRGLDGTVALSALAMDANGLELDSSQIRYRACNPWSFFTDPERDCPVDAALSLDAAELSTENLLAFYPPPVGLDTPELEGEPQQACNIGSPIEVPVLAEAQMGETKLITVKRIPVYLDETRRQNPALAPIEVEAIRDGEYTFALRVDSESLDVECRDDLVQLEAVRIYVYATAGSFESSSVDIVPTPTREVEPAQIRWTSNGDSAILFFVAVDREGGVDWKSIAVDGDASER